MRKSLDATWQFLESQSEEMPRDANGKPFIPPAMPSYDDEEIAFSFFRTECSNADFSNLTLPRTFFGRSLLKNVNFSNTDLSESRMCWNDFEDCDFSRADLSHADMRGSHFKNCKFSPSILRQADLRRSSFENCDFAGSDLAGALGWNSFAEYCLRDALTVAQQSQVLFSIDEGPEPPGG